MTAIAMKVPVFEDVARRFQKRASSGHDPAISKFFEFARAVTKEPAKADLSVPDLFKQETFAAKLSKVKDTENFASELVTKLGSVSKRIVVKAQEDLFKLAGYVHAFVQLKVTGRLKKIKDELLVKMLCQAKAVLRACDQRFMDLKEFSVIDVQHIKKFIGSIAPLWLTVEGNRPSQDLLQRMFKDLNKIIQPVMSHPARKKEVQRLRAQLSESLGL